MPGTSKTPKLIQIIQVWFKLKSNLNQIEFKPSQVQFKFNQDAQHKRVLGYSNRHHPGSIAEKHTRKRGLTSEKT